MRHWEYGASGAQADVIAMACCRLDITATGSCSAWHWEYDASGGQLDIEAVADCSADASMGMAKIDESIIKTTGRIFECLPAAKVDRTSDEVDRLRSTGFPAVGIGSISIAIPRFSPRGLAATISDYLETMRDRSYCDRGHDMASAAFVPSPIPWRL